MIPKPTLEIRRWLRSGALFTFRGLSIVAFVVLAGLLVAISAGSNPAVAIALATFLLFFVLRALLPVETIDRAVQSLMTGEAGERAYLWLEARVQTLTGWFK